LAEPTRVFWDDLQKELEDPEFLREYIIESVRVSAIDNLINQLNDARDDAGLTKADLARAVNMKPAVVRRMLSSKNANPTLGTLAEIAAALGLAVSLTPLSDSDAALITTPLLTGESSSLALVAKRHTAHQLA
jgi:transcriptional regulator with XRE-family HTH domain